jgi:hypothetical protein
MGGRPAPSARLQNLPDCTTIQCPLTYSGAWSITPIALANGTRLLKRWAKTAHVRLARIVYCAEFKIAEVALKTARPIARVDDRSITVPPPWTFYSAARQHLNYTDELTVRERIVWTAGVANAGNVTPLTYHQIASCQKRGLGSQHWSEEEKRAPRRTPKWKEHAAMKAPTRPARSPTHKFLLGISAVLIPTILTAFFSFIYTTIDSLPIPMKSPGHSEMMPPMDSDMMSPRARASLATEVVTSHAVEGQSFLAGFARIRRRLSPVRSMRWALWTRRSRIASA